MDPEDQPLQHTDDAGPAAAASEDRGHPGPAARRSYECTFCKRGFSNAQALGGHMNIHRKDRAKLQHPPSQAQLPFDVTPAPYSPLLAAPRRAVSVQHPSSSSSPRQLPLFVEAPSSYGSGAYDRDSRKTTEHGQGAVELDLELRLGPERRPDAPSPAMGLKEFV